MTVTIEGDRSDTCPVTACVVRFIRAAEAQDQEAGLAAIHPDQREGLRVGGIEAPPMASVRLEEASIESERALVPAQLIDGDGSEQRFVFVLRPYDETWGIDLPASVQETFGFDPTDLMQDLMEQAVEPFKQAIGAVGDALSGAFAGGTDAEGDEAPAVARIAVDETIATSLAEPETVAVRIRSLSWERRVERDGDGVARSNSLQIRCRFSLPDGWVAMACKGADLAEASDLHGDALQPEQDDRLGAEHYASWERSEGDYNLSLTLLPGPGFTGLAELNGTLHLDLIGGGEYELLLPFAEYAERAVHLAALGFALELDRDEEGQLVLRAPDGCFDACDISVADAAGEVLSSSYWGHGDGQTDTRTYEVQIPADGALRLRFHACRRAVALPFHVAGLPLALD